MTKSNVFKTAANLKGLNKMDEEGCRTSGQDCFMPETRLPYITARLFHAKNTIAAHYGEAISDENTVTAHYGCHVSIRKYDCRTLRHGYFGLKTWLPHVTAAIFPIENTVAVHYGDHLSVRKHDCRTLR